MPSMMHCTVYRPGDQVRVAGRSIIIEVGPDGAETLDRAELARAVREWTN